jgi:cystathionine beta-lyase/cystathionine gamma-synthase
MDDKDLFFMRAPWVYDREEQAQPRPDAHLGFDTRALHAGFDPLGDLEPLRSFVPPITPSMTYPYTRFDEIPYPVYGRTQTPTTALLEERLASLEGGEAAITGASGSQALFNLIFTLARPGDNVVTSLNTFGEGYQLAAHLPRSDLWNQPHHLHASGNHHPRAHDPRATSPSGHRRRLDPPLRRVGKC